MPRRPKKPCAYSSCAKLVEAGQRYCDEHRKSDWKNKDKDRGTSAERGYNTRVWRKVRAAALRDEPLCRRCGFKGMIVAAKVVHHIDEDSSNNLRSNLEPLCVRCHSSHHGFARQG